MALPALIRGQIHGLRRTTNLLWPISMPWLLFALSAAAFLVLARFVRPGNRLPPWHPAMAAV